MVVSSLFVFRLVKHSLIPPPFLRSICPPTKPTSQKQNKSQTPTMNNGRRPIAIPSIYTRDSSVSSHHRPSTTVSSINTNFSNKPAQIPTRTASTATTATTASTAAPVAPVAPVARAAPQNGVLLLVIAGSPSKQLKSYVHTALLKGPAIAEVLVVGETKDEQAIKQLKVDLYGLAGSLKRELSLRVESVQGALTEEPLRQHLSSVLDRRGQTGGEADKKELHGVLCDLDEHESQPLDVLEVETTVLMDQWLRSVGFIHAIARTTIPLLRVAAHRAMQATSSTEQAAKRPFFATTLSSSAASSGAMHATGLRALLDSLSTLGNREITFGSADTLLAPEPEPVVQENHPVVAPTSGWRDEPDDLSPGESPTKLWGMWSQYQEGNF